MHTCGMHRARTDLHALSGTPLALPMAPPVQYASATGGTQNDWTQIRHTHEHELIRVCVHVDLTPWYGTQVGGGGAHLRDGGRIPSLLQREQGGDVQSHLRRQVQLPLTLLSGARPRVVSYMALG